MKRIPLLKSLRFRLVLCIVLLQLGVLAALLLNVERVWSGLVLRATEQRVGELSRLLNASFAPTMAALDYTPASELMDSVRSEQGIAYLRLLDRQGRQVASSGLAAESTLPSPMSVSQLRSAREVPSLVHVQTSIELAGQRYGELRFGLSTALLRDAAAKVAWQSAMVLILGTFLAGLVLSLLGLWFTQRLARLSRAAEQHAQYGEMGPLDCTGDDEISQLTQCFGQMAGKMQDRLALLQESEAKFAAIADYSYAIELWLDPAGKLLWINASVERLSGYTVAQCMAMAEFPLDLASIEDRPRLRQALERAAASAAGQDFEFRAQRRDGTAFWASLSWQQLHDGQGVYQGIRASIRDNSQLKDERLALKGVVQELERSQALNQVLLETADVERARLCALLAAMRFGVLFVNNEHAVVYHNPAFCRLWSIAEDQLVNGKQLREVMGMAENCPADYPLLTLINAEGESSREVQLYDLHMRDGRIINQQCFSVRDELGMFIGRLWVYEDVTQAHQLNEQMTYLAERDALTGLFNRYAFQEQLRRVLLDAERDQNQVAVLYFDLDEFKYINDTFGHTAGDELLKRVGQEVLAQIRRNECLARLGGDEFALLIPNCQEAEIGHVASRIVAAVASIAMDFEGRLMRMSSSLGVAIYPQHAQNAQELVAHADTAMYQAKTAGKATWRMYAAEQDQTREMVDRLGWIERIQQAIDHDGFVLYFQGIYDARSRAVAHLEALVRMKDPDQPDKILPPGHFIPHAERCGKVLDIDRWVIAESVRLLAAYPMMPSVAVNISGRSFDNTELPAYIADQLQARGVAPQRLMVELTETAALSDMRDAQRFIGALRNTGCSVCLDDFGAGFSSFAYLKHIEAQVLKIDGLFIRDLPRDRDSQIFVKGMAQIARDMGKQTVAEFVEDEETLQMLIAFGVDMVQGYYLDKPTVHHPSMSGLLQVAISH